MATYYVSKDSGNNAWDGLFDTFQGGTSGPKATIAAVLAILIKGDTVRIIKGATAYDVGGYLLPVLGGAAEGDRVTFKGWVVGQASTDILTEATRPVLSALTGGGADIMDLNDNSYISLLDLEMNGGQVGFDGVDGNLASYLRIQRCKIANVQQAWQATVGPITDVLIEDNEISFCRTDGLNSSTSLNGITIRRNYIHDILDGGLAGDAIQLQHQVNPPLLGNVLIEDNRIENFEKEGINIGGCRTGTCIIRRNKLDATGQTVDPSDCIDVSSSLNITIEDNEILDPSGNGIRVYTSTYGGTPFLSGGATIRRNLVTFSGETADFKRGIYVQSHDGTQGPVNIYSNTVYGTIEGIGGGGDGIVYRVDTGDGSGDPVCNIRNNISAENDQEGLVIRGTYVGGTVTVNNDYNCYYGNGSGPISDANGWGNDPESNGLTSDPQFRDVNSGDFRLDPSSPCIGAGDNAVASLHGGDADIGGIEYGAPLVTPGGRPARMRGGKYYRHGSSRGLITLEKMER